jgi:hypothetical protein
MKLRTRKLLEWLDRTSPLLETQIVASGSSGALNEALRYRLVDMGAHPTVRERRGVPAPPPSRSPMPGARRLLAHDQDRAARWPGE